MEEIIVRILILLISLPVGWSLGYCFCNAIKPIPFVRRKKKLKKEQEENEKTWTITPPEAHPKIEIEFYGSKLEFDLMCQVGRRALTKYSLDKVVVIERQDNGLVKQYETIMKEKKND